MSSKKISPPSSAGDVAEFLRKAAITAQPNKRRGRLIFALDATASRQPTWDRACHLQNDMFIETASMGGLLIQPVWYRGYREFYSGRWFEQAKDLVSCMNTVSCVGGMTQIGRVLDHAISETRRYRLNALVFIGDCMEENTDILCAKAGQLGLLGVPVFIFHEGGEPVAAQAFRQIARLSHGAYCSFDSGSAQQLRELLGAVAVYAAGGQPALEKFSKHKSNLTLRLVHQLQGNK